MKLHTALLKQALLLAKKEPRRPVQASLRRSISASYYALFHRLVDDATRTLVSGRDHNSLRQTIARAFHHKDMRSMSKSLAAGTPPDKISAAFIPMPIDAKLKGVAQAFVDLQEARHQADYDTSRLFTRSEAIYNQKLASRAINDWATIRKGPQATAYLVGLLIIGRIQGS